MEKFQKKKFELDFFFFFEFIRQNIAVCNNLKEIYRIRLVTGSSLATTVGSRASKGARDAHPIFLAVEQKLLERPVAISVFFVTVSIPPNWPKCPVN